jgi:diguanylate cyclase (GGDEF)-like protein
VNAPDHVTGLAARADLERVLEAVCLGDAGAPAAAVICDVVGLKAINESSGFTAGDEVLRAAAERLRVAAAAAAVIGRLGGDELVALFTGPEAPARAELASRRLAGDGVPPLRSAALTAQKPEPPQALIDRLYAAMRGS